MRMILLTLVTREPYGQRHCSTMDWRKRYRNLTLLTWPEYAHIRWYRYKCFHSAIPRLPAPLSVRWRQPQ